MTETIIKQPSWWNRRSSFEKSLTIIVGLVMLTAIVLAIAVILAIFRYPKAPPQICTSHGCVEYASQILRRMNQSAEPCDDFYEFACGNFKNVQDIPEEKLKVNYLTIIADKIDNEVRHLLEEPININEPKSFELAKKFYRACVNETNIELQGLEPMKKVFSDLGGWPVLEGDNWNESDFSWMQMNYKLRQKGLSIHHLFSFYVDLDSKDPKKQILKISQATLELGRENLLIDIDNKLLKGYYHFMVDIAVIFGANKTTAEAELMDAFLFQRELANISLSQIELRNASALYNPMSVDDLQKMHPFIPWLDYINNILSPVMKINNTEIIVNRMPSYITKLEKLLKETPNRTIANYLLWQVIFLQSFALPKTVLDAQLKFINFATQVSKSPPRWQRCVHNTQEKFDSLVGSLYVRKNFDKESKNKLVQIVNDIQNVFKSVLSKTDWMDMKTKKSALKKLNAMEKHLAYPDEILNDEILDDYFADVKVNESSYLESLLMLGQFNSDISFKYLREPVNKSHWASHANAAQVGAYYNQYENSIRIPAGLLQSSVFSNDRPNYANYATIGFIVGHEITHGFDNEGRQFDKEGEVSNWWDSVTEKNFLKKAQCIVDQYSKYTVMDINQNIDGILTEGENIADNGGLKQAYTAYRTWLLRNRNQQEPQLPGLAYTSQQMFWISMASTWCSNDKPEYLRLMLRTNEHAPYHFRVIGPISNQPGFAIDFQCSGNSTMNPKEKCQVW